MRPLLLRLLVLPPLALSLMAVCGETHLLAQNGGGAALQQSQQTPPGSSESPQNSAPTPPEGTAPPPLDTTAPKPQFFAGTVTKLDSQQITVSRTLVGKAPETRTFLIQAKTKLNRSVRVKQRVTVRYEHVPEGDVALEVQIRQRSPKTS